jgi:hypothetical protein
MINSTLLHKVNGMINKNSMSKDEFGGIVLDLYKTDWRNIMTFIKNSNQS